MKLPNEFYQELYKHHLDLYQKRRFSKKSGLFNLELCNLYSNKLIELGLLTKEDHEMNLLPNVDIAALLGRKGSICGDGIE
jgi:hypothetical protein